MASHLQPKIVAMLADASISSPKGKALKHGTDFKHVAVGAANTDKVFGLCQSDTVAGAESVVEVAVLGGAKGLLGETVVAGDPLCSHTDGSLVKPNALGDYVIARAMEGGVAGDIVDVILSHSQAVAAV